MDFLLSRESKIPVEGFIPSEENKANFEEVFQVLVVGAGGLGCEILKNLALCGVKNIYVVDLDTIELSNLNRQFLFRQADIGKYKAEVAAEYIKKKYPDINIKSSIKKVQAFTDDFFRSFHVIIGGLDNVEARRYLNEKVHDLVTYDENGEINPESVIPYVDGGTEGFRGQSRVIIPYTTACFECTVNAATERNTYALCTIAQTPRIPEHCIEYAYIILWKQNHDRAVDKDSIEDVQWIYEKALERSKQYKIEGVTYNLTLGVIKGIIPAIASTNALIAASTVMETIKIATACSKRLDNYFMYMGHEGVYADTSQYQQNPSCKVCQVKIKEMKFNKETKFAEAYKKIKEDLHLSEEDTNASTFKDMFVVKGKCSDEFKDLTIGKLIEDGLLSESKYLLIEDAFKELPFKIRIKSI
ncbi:MAG: ThiF family adenylyltransferase [archaeon]|nr:ThiF family adenylyltransferase [archaeon]